MEGSPSQGRDPALTESFVPDAHRGTSAGTAITVEYEQTLEGARERFRHGQQLNLEALQIWRRFQAERATAKPRMTWSKMQLQGDGRV